MNRIERHCLDSDPLLCNQVVFSLLPCSASDVIAEGHTDDKAIHLRRAIFPFKLLKVSAFFHFLLFKMTRDQREV